MNTISHILSIECTNTQHIYLYREGIFLKAYERSAYAFVTGVQSFRVKKRFVKNVNKEIVSIGFPSEGLYKHFAKEKVKEVENRTEIELEQGIDLAAFEQWKQGVELIIEKVKSPPPSPTTSAVVPGAVSIVPVVPSSLSEQEVLMKIRVFPIEGKTPMECMLFLSELKRIL